MNKRYGSSSQCCYWKKSLQEDQKVDACFPLLKTLPSSAEDDVIHDDDDDDNDAAFQDSSQQASWLQDGMESHQNGGGGGGGGGGDGIVQFLPGDIKGLETKLNYLLGEYRAENRSSFTKNQIVSILDELLRRKRLSRKEYREINTFLQ